MSRVLKRHRHHTYDICEVCGGPDAISQLNVLSCWKCTRFFAKYYNKSHLRDCVFMNRCLNQADQSCLYSCQDCWMNKCKNVGMTLGNSVVQVKNRNYETTIIVLDREEKEKQEAERIRLKNLLDLSGVKSGEASPNDTASLDTAGSFDYMNQESEFLSFENPEANSSILLEKNIKEEELDICEGFELNEHPASYDYLLDGHQTSEPPEDIKPSEFLPEYQIMEEKPSVLEETTVPERQYPDNIAILPTTKIVFNAPFDEEDVTKFRIFNKSEFRIAFKVEIQSQGRLKSDQIYGIIDSGNSERIDLKCDFEASTEGSGDWQHDRIFVNLQNLAENEERNLEDVFLDDGLRITKILNVEYNS